MALTIFQKYLLKRIIDGEIIFSLETEKMTIEQFQTFARGFTELKDAGYIDMRTHRQSKSEHNYINGIYDCKLAKWNAYSD